MEVFVLESNHYLLTQKLGSISGIRNQWHWKNTLSLASLPVQSVPFTLVVAKCKSFSEHYVESALYVKPSFPVREGTLRCVYLENVLLSSENNWFNEATCFNVLARPVNHALSPPAVSVHTSCLLPLSYQQNLLVYHDNSNSSQF